MKKLTSAVVASSLVLGLVGTALAAPTADEQQASYARMEALKLVQGTDRGPELEGPLTRAQLLTIIVRAFKYEDAAKLLNEVSSFSDVPGGQWYSGYVAIAKSLATEKGFAIGYPDGTFKPNNQVTVIEALAMIMKFLGVPVGTGDNWVAQTIENAKAAGVITDADVEKFLSDPNAPATRGVAIALADQIFYNYKLVGDKTVYTYYVDNQAPVISVDPIGTPTVDVAEITLKGKIEGADKAFVTPQGGEQMEITLAADGSFSVVVPLVAGENRIVISATDLAGNYAEYVVPVNRVAGAPAAIKVESTEIELVAGETVELEYAVVDASGLELADAKENVKVTVSEEVGVLNEDGTITVAQKVGQGEIVLSYEGLEDVVLTAKVVPAALDSVALEVDGKRVESAAPSETVTLVAVDAYGNKIEGAVFTENEANAVVEGDKFTAFKPGTYTVTVTVGEGEEAVSKDVEVVVYGEAEELDIQVPASMVRNGETEYTVTVKAVDKNGALVRDYDGYITIGGDFKVVGENRVKAKNGVATFKVTVPETLKEGVIWAEGDDDLEAEIEVETVAQVATAVKLTASQYLALNRSRGLDWTGSVTVVDQEGVKMRDDDEEWDVTLEIEGPAYLVDNDRKVRRMEVTVVGGSSESFEIVSSDNDTEGQVVITATADDLKSDSKTVKTVWAGTPKKFVLTKVTPADDDAIQGNQAIYRIGLADRNDVPVRPIDDIDVTLTFNTNDVSVQYVQAARNSEADAATEFNNAETVEVKDKKAKITFEGDAEKPYLYILVTNKKPSNNIKLTVSAPGYTSASVDVEYVASKATQLAFDSPITLRPGESKKVTVQLVDDYNVPVREVVKLTVDPQSDRISVNGRRPGAAATVYTDSNGKATVEIGAEWNIRDTEKVVLKADLDGVQDELIVKRASSVADDLKLGWMPEVLAETSSLSLWVKVTDRRGNPYVYDGNPVFDVTVKLTTSDGRTVDESFEVTAHREGDPGWYVFDLAGGLSDTFKNDGILKTGEYEVTVADNRSVYTPSDSVSFRIVGSNEATSVKIKDGTSYEDELEVKANPWVKAGPIQVDLLTAADEEQVATGGTYTATVTIDGDGVIALDSKSPIWKKTDLKFPFPTDGERSLKFVVMGDTSGTKTVTYTITVKDAKDFEVGSVTITLKAPN